VTGPSTDDDRSPAAVAPGDNAKTFTSRKLDWLDCLAHDSMVAPLAFEIGYCIMSHLNAKSGRAWVSDETLADKSGNSERTVRRARTQLRAAGWITWKRTSTANVYTPQFQKVNAMLDSIISKRDERTERREKRRRKTNSHRPQLADHKPRDRTQMAGHDRPELTEHDRPELADIHFRVNTLD
jgi:Helix-turn-helix domain